MDRRRAVADTDPDDRRSVVGKGAIQGGSDPLGLLDLDAEQTEGGRSDYADRRSKTVRC